jgi:hypothetical protein
MLKKKFRIKIILKNFKAIQTKLMLQIKKVVAGDLKKMKDLQNKLKMSGDLN